MFGFDLIWIPFQFNQTGLPSKRTRGPLNYSKKQEISLFTLGQDPYSTVVSFGSHPQSWDMLSPEFLVKNQLAGAQQGMRIGMTPTISHPTAGLL